jgi:hypothetical protein
MTFFHWSFAIENLLPVKLHKLADQKYEAKMTPSQYRLAEELVEMIHEDFRGFIQATVEYMPRDVITQPYLRQRRRQRS